MGSQARKEVTTGLIRINTVSGISRESPVLAVMIRSRTGGERGAAHHAGPGVNTLQHCPSRATEPVTTMPKGQRFLAGSSAGNPSWRSMARGTDRAFGTQSQDQMFLQHSGRVREPLRRPAGWPPSAVHFCSSCAAIPGRSNATIVRAHATYQREQNLCVSSESLEILRF